ncbi:MAG TPA: TonB-dependent receptor [Caulobacterales bacterium]|nr:TonB-dependent receptor [Caulobacterales bacterium]
MRVWLASAGAFACLTARALAADAPPNGVEDLRGLSIEQLSQLQVTSVSKAPQGLNTAAAAVFVITHDDIVRSGLTSIPEILRLAPNLQVYATSASTYVVTARGFNGNGAAQSFANKLLVLIDGRSVYTPLFSGVYWDMQDVRPDNIERIEVISGPGATLWGANAVNGVINIITRRAEDTQGLAFDAEAGDRLQRASLQYGGRFGGDVAWRAYIESFHDDGLVTAAGESAHDEWSRPQGGFRLDWAPAGADALTVQGDAYAGARHQGLGAPPENIAGQNLLTRWTRELDGGSSLQVQGFYDFTSRETEMGNGSLALRMYDLDVQHSFALGQRHSIVWGGGMRIERYSINGTATLQFEPARRQLNLSNLFVQDTIALTGDTNLTLGLKAEDDPYVNVSWLPNIRLSWAPSETLLAWGAASRAVRSPTPFDRDVREYVGPTLFLTGDDEFRTEKVTAYELGLRLRPMERATFSISAFYNEYDDLRSIELGPGGTLPPIAWGNGMEGETKGVEAWGDLELAPWWRVRAGYAWLEKNLGFEPGAVGLLGVATAGDDPESQAQIGSAMTFADVTIDANLRYMSELPDPRVPAYTEMNARIGWNLTDQVQLAIAGYNLLDDHHQEYPGAAEVPRSAYAQVRFRY